MGGDAASDSGRSEAIRLALRELGYIVGYIEGQNIALEYRYAEGCREIIAQREGFGLFYLLCLQRGRTVRPREAATRDQRKVATIRQVEERAMVALSEVITRVRIIHGITGR
jgi:hypothetical protein